MQYGGTLPVYSGTRYQRGGGILSSIARFVLPTAKKMLTETAKAAPGVINSVLSDGQPVGSAILSGLKTAGMNTANDAFQRVTGRRSTKRPARVSKRRAPTKQPPRKRRKQAAKDIFT